MVKVMRNAFIVFKNIFQAVFSCAIREYNLLGVVTPQNKSDSFTDQNICPNNRY